MLGAPFEVFNGFFFEVAVLPGCAWYKPNKYDFVVKFFLLFSLQCIVLQYILFAIRILRLRGHLSKDKNHSLSPAYTYNRIIIKTRVAEIIFNQWLVVA